MNRQNKFLGALLLAVLAVSAVFPRPVSAALSVSGVSPNPIVNDITNTITVAGTDFASGAQVSIGATPVATAFVDVSTLTAVIPAGFTAGVYDVNVTVGVDTSTLSGGLTINAPTPTTSPTATATATNTPTVTLAPFGRPQLVIQTYQPDVDAIRYGQDFTLYVRLVNAGQFKAYNVQVTFTSSDLLPLSNGGVSAIADIASGAASQIGQQMTAAAPLYGKNMVQVDMGVTYYDDKGASYNDKFTLMIPAAVYSSSNGVVHPTATPTGLRRSQLVITKYETDVQPLQPGLLFTLNITVQNMGTVPAKGVTMIIGGGSSGAGGGTPQPGVSGGSGEFTNFAPVGSSNIQSLGDVQPAGMLQVTQKLVVNVSTNPGAYPMKISFSYVDDRGNAVNDDQVITLLVYSLPNVDIGFYQPVPDLLTGQPAALPFQVTNLGKKNTVLGKMKVVSNQGIVENGEMLVGSLDPGGYFTLDSSIVPDRTGPLDLTITIEYTDDFNMPRTITRTISLTVIDAPFEPTPDFTDQGDQPGVSGTETFWQKLVRFLLGLLGLDSSAPSTTGPMEIPATEAPIIIQGGKGG